MPSAPQTQVRPTARSAETGQRKPIAELLVDDGVITPDQLARARRVQEYLEEPMRLIEVLVELGDVSEEAVAETVAKYGKTYNIGEILLQQGLINEKILETAIKAQEETGRRIGEILIDMGAINEPLLLHNVADQLQMPYMEPSFTMVDTTLLEKASPEFLEKHCFVPFSRNEDGSVVVVINDHQDREAADAICDLFQDTARLALGPRDAILATIEDYRNFRQVARARDRRVAVGEDSVVEQVEHIIIAAIHERASDIHFEPMADKVRLRYRIDGVLVYKTDLPKEIHARIISRIKIMAQVDIAEHQRHQGGRILFTHKGVEYDLRLSIYVTVHGECAVLRILNKEMGLLSLQELGMSPGLLKTFKRDVLDIPTGVVLITAPTGEGKTTTLYSSLDYCNDISIKIITAEDPVEYMLDGIIQCSIYDKIGRTFESTLREIVRQDPDIVVLGEIRDKVTAEFAIQAALTGHKVYCTFHTGDTVAALLRLMDMQIETFLIASTVLSVLAQRLLRRVCAGCADIYRPTIEDMQVLGVDPDEMRQHTFKRGRGCKACSFTGYKGRVAVFECLLLNDAIRDAILEKRTAGVIRELAYEGAGMVSMRESGIVKAVQGVTTLGEVKRCTPVPYRMRPIHQLLRMVQ